MGVLLLAGCSAEALGDNKPMGMYKPGLQSDKSMFRLLIERFIKAQMVACGVDNIFMAPLHCKLIIMTNADTHELVTQYFHQNSYFGIMKENIVFVEAHRMPILSNDGNILLKSRGEVAMASAGNGAFFDTLNTNEQLRSFMEEELDYVQIIGVKNLLTKVLDPAQIGYAFKQNA